MVDEAPDFVVGSPLVERAYELACRAYGADGGDVSAAVEHPLQVASILHDAGLDAEVVAAGVLHDILEDTEHPAADLERVCGPRVTELVQTMTEDESIESYRERKADHRARLARSDRAAAAIFAADKLAKVRELASDDDGAEAKLEHYSQSARMLRESHPGVPLLDRLESELRQYRAAGDR